MVNASAVKNCSIGVATSALVPVPSAAPAPGLSACAATTST